MRRYNIHFNKSMDINDTAVICQHVNSILNPWGNSDVIDTPCGLHTSRHLGDQWALQRSTHGLASPARPQRCRHTHFAAFPLPRKVKLNLWHELNVWNSNSILAPHVVLMNGRDLIWTYTMPSLTINLQKALTSLVLDFISSFRLFDMCLTCCEMNNLTESLAALCWAVTCWR